MTDSPDQTLCLVDEHMPPDISRDTRQLIQAISAVQDLEFRLPLMDSIEEVESMRIQCGALADWAWRNRSIHPAASSAPRPEEWIAAGKELHRWATRVAMMCQRRVGQLLHVYINPAGGRPRKKNGTTRAPFSEAPPKPTLAELGLDKHFASDAKVMADVPESRVTEAADKGIKKTRLIKEIRREAKAKGAKLDEKTIEQRADGRIRSERFRSKQNQERARQSAANPTDPSEVTSKKFQRYWTKEKKLLYANFETQELAKVAEYWWREFHFYRSEEEKILADHRQDRDRRKAAAKLAKE